MATAALEPTSVDPSALRSAQNVFTAQIGRSFSVDLGDLATEAWSLLPTTSDFLAEIPTRRFGTLTYAHSTSQPEDITLFNRDQRHNLSIYASKTRLAVQGPFYNEDDEADYDVLDYNVDVQFSPERLWLEGHGRVKLRIRAYALGAITLRLAGPLQVRSVVSDTFGRLLPLRVRNQETLVVNLPTPLNRAAEITLTIAYGGRLDAQHVDREAIGVGQARRAKRSSCSRSRAGSTATRQYWYPQGTFSDYATAQVRMSVPRGYGAVCTGDQAGGSPVTVRTGNGEPRMVYVFAATQPVRYLGCLVSRFVAGESQDISLGSGVPTAAGCARGAPLRHGQASLDDQRAPAPADPRDARTHCRHHLVLFGAAARRAVPVVHARRRRERFAGGTQPGVLRRAADAVAWQPFRVARRSGVVRELSGVLSRARSGASVVGPRGGLAQLSRAVAERGFRAVLRRAVRGASARTRGLRRHHPNHEPLGRRRPPIRDPSIWDTASATCAATPASSAPSSTTKARWCCTCCGVCVGDEAFFNGLRRFYDENRFQKAGTDGLRQAFEAETGRSLSRFFERWIYSADLPALTWTTRTEGSGDDQAS